MSPDTLQSVTLFLAALNAPALLGVVRLIWRMHSRIVVIETKLGIPQR